METTTMIQVKELTRTFKRFTLGPLNLDVERGIAVGVIGANGSGKTTLFRLIMRLLKEDTGNIQMFGLTEENDEWKGKIGFAGGLLDAYDFLRVEELKNLISRWYPAWDEDQFLYFVNRYKIDVFERFGKCSKGTKKKLEFVFALSHNPELLLLDEPTAGVDLVSQRKMKEDLIRFMEDGTKSILLATHEVDEINQLCDEIVVLDRGRVMHRYNKDDIYDQWARIWVSVVNDDLIHHPNVIHYETAPPQIVTNQVEAIQEIVQKNEMKIQHIQRLSMEEVLEYLIESN